MSESIRPLLRAPDNYSSENEERFRKEVETYLVGMSSDVSGAINANVSGSSLASKREMLLEPRLGVTSVGGQFTDKVDFNPSNLTLMTITEYISCTLEEFGSGSGDPSGKPWIPVIRFLDFLHAYGPYPSGRVAASFSAPETWGDGEIVGAMVHHTHAASASSESIALRIQMGITTASSGSAAVAPAVALNEVHAVSLDNNVDRIQGTLLTFDTALSYAVTEPYDTVISFGLDRNTKDAAKDTFTDEAWDLVQISFLFNGNRRS